MKKYIYGMAVFLASTGTTVAQRQVGTSLGSYNTLNSLYLNPANLGGCTEKLGFSALTGNIAADNNLGTISSISEIIKTVGDGADAGKLFKYTNSSEFSLMLPMVELRGPGVLFRMNNRHTLALTTRVRAFNELNNFSRNLYVIVTDPGNAGNTDIRLTAKNFNWTAHLWSETALSYGVVAFESDNMQLNCGITLRMLSGIGYIGMKGKNLDVTYRGGSDSVYAANSDIEFSSNVTDANDAFNNGVNGGKILGGAGGAHGFGADLGVTFQLNTGRGNSDDINQPNSYDLKFSAAVTDIGSIKYNNGFFVNLTGNGYITGKGISDSVSNYDEFRTYAVRHGYSADTGTTSTKLQMPTSLLISGDYAITRKLHINAMMAANLITTNNYMSRYYSQLTVTPYLDTRLVTLGLPITYNMLTNNIRLGLGARLYSFYFGSDDMMSLISGNQYGFNFYAGAMVPIYKKRG